MFVLGNFIVAVAKIIDIALTAYMWIIVIRAVLSWVNPDPYNPIVRFITQITEPVMAPIRRWIPLRGMGIDFSPMIILLVIVFLQSFLVPSLMQLAYSFR
jgi:YggT family protein